MKIISTIAIDLGAKHTGVYFAHYREGVKVESIKRSGTIYHLEKDKYTLLMRDRTAKRHQRCCIDRCQMVKRLFKLIWEKHFKLAWDKDVQQTISFLFNRRGFSYLTEEYDKEILQEFPEDAFQLLPNILREDVEPNANGSYDLDRALLQWSTGSEDKVNKIYENLKKEQEEKKDDAKWKFNPEKFNLDTAKFYDNDEKPNVKTHLYHLCFAVHMIWKELRSGGRHRSKYFEEIKEVLQDKGHTSLYLKIFCKKLQSGEFKGLNAENFTNLLGHLSNLELKPLRKYFNDKKHQNGDYWDQQRLSKFFSEWIRNTWRVDANKDKKKARGKEYDYRKLKNKWCDSQKRDECVVDFWLKTDSNWTIPPYQDNNNRRLPKCQSLILNPKFLNKKYPDWKLWLGKIKNLQTVAHYLGEFEKDLKEIKGSSGKVYFADCSSRYARKVDELNARILQFIFDRTKDSDQLHLNEIYSHTKKYRQLQSSEQEKSEAKKNLEETIADSELPDDLKTNRDYNTESVFTKEGFLHLVCKYYKLRQKARDGRIFIHPKYREHNERGYDHTGSFDDDDHLLTYCNYKPRRKQYQLLSHLAGLLQISTDKIEEAVDSSKPQDIEKWLSEISGLKSNAQKASDEQKKHRGNLKLEVEKVYFNEKRSDALYKFCERAKRLCIDIDEKLNRKEDKSLTNNNVNLAVNAVFKLAQINNLIFKDRSGNANTCAVCSMDNAQRMQQSDNRAKASRLPAISTRLIDGAVMRMARIVGSAIADDKWPSVKKELKQGNKVRIPIITESNRFEFEEDLATLKGKNKKKGEQKDYFQDKEERIKKASNEVCPYTGESLSGSGERDHIIPRSSSHETLNDEANLIFASENGNKKKGDKIYRISELHKKYKQKQFGTVNGNRDQFTFGQYRNFINLTSDQQKAFRHALFLTNIHPLRKKVIAAIEHRFKSFGNGTQRYFAQVIADNLYKKAKKMGNGKEKLVSFDFFGVDARYNSKGDGVSNLRENYEKVYPELNAYTKRKGKHQEIYSHLIDAQLAFCIAADAHKKEGSFKLETGDCVLFPAEGKTDIFNKIKIKPEEMREHKLKRKKPNENFCSHRSFTRDTFYADHYLPILFKEIEGEVEVKLGFDWQNSIDFKERKKNIGNIGKIISLCRHTEIEDSTSFSSFEEIYKRLTAISHFHQQLQFGSYCYLQVDKQALHRHFFENYNTKNGNHKDDFFDFCWKDLGYRTERKAIISGSELEKIVKNEKNFKLKNGNILPAKQEWDNCLKAWKIWQKENNDNFNEFLRCHFLHDKSKKYSHQKVRKVFSLPVVTGQGKLLLRRKSWNGEYTNQIINDSDSRSPDNKPKLPVKLENDSLGTGLARWAKSKNIVKLDSNKYQEGECINPCTWYLVNDKYKKDFPDGIDRIWYRIDYSTAPSIRLQLGRDGSNLSADLLDKKVCQHGLRKTKDKSKDAVRNDFFETEIAPKIKGEYVIYKGAQYNIEMNAAFKTATIDPPDEASCDM